MLSKDEAITRLTELLGLAYWQRDLVEFLVDGLIEATIDEYERRLQKQRERAANREEQVHRDCMDDLQEW